MSELALKLIKEAKDKRLTRLDLRWTGLTKYPKALFQLTWLEELLLSNDDESYHYDYYGDKLISENNREYIANNLKFIHHKISNLKNLKKLTISAHPDEDIWEIKDLSPLENLANLEVLDISCTQVSNLQPIRNLTNLKSLHIFQTEVKDLTPLKNLTNLEYLLIFHTQISDLNPIESLTNLREIYAREAPIFSLKPLKNLTNIELLDLNHTKVYDLEPLKNLIKLESLELTETYIDDLSPLENLTNLKHLVLSGTEVSDLSPLKNIIKLKTLQLESIPIEDLTPLQNMTELRSITVWNTQVSDLYPLSSMINLEYLNCERNQIKSIAPLQNLLNLSRLNIGENQISDLSPLKKLLEKGFQINDYLDGISVNGCPLTNPPQFIVEQGNEAILSYWYDLETKKSQTNNQTKLIFIGNSRAGKTSLWQFLKDKIYNEQADSTHGIKTEIWDTEPLGTEDNQNLAAHIWDFGGQEYYHATHRLFLADNAVYVLVWENASNKQGTRLEKFKLDDDPNGEIEEVALEHFPASYWLDNIRYFGGAHCPVLIVQNKVDFKEDFSPHTEGVSETADCFHLSIKNAFARLNTGKTDYDFEKFKETLLDLLRKNATAFKLVKYYAQVREALEVLAKDTEYIPVSELKNIALRFDETPDLENLLAYLKSFTNTVLYFPQNEVLKDRLYLNPTHISRDIYKILNKTVRDNKGKFDITHIKTRLNLTDNQEAERFLALMHEFDLIFEKQDEKREREFIAPQYLQQKDHLARGGKLILKTFQLAFHLRFKSFVPRSMMLRFIAQNGAAAFEEFYWRNGIVYQGCIENTFIKVEYDSEACTFAIEVQDKQKQALDMQQVVAQFVKLNNSDDNIEISNDGKKYVDLRTIRNLQHENRRGDIYDKGALIPLTHFDWLIEKPKIETTMTLEELKAKVQSFISKAKTKEAMEAMATWAHEQNQEQLKSDITLLQGDFTDLSREKTLGLLNNSEAGTRQNQLNYKVMNLVNALEVSVSKAKTPSMDAEKAQKKTRDKPLSIFISYSKNDNELRQELHTHLSSLRRRKIVSNWDDRHIIGGELWDDTIKTKLKEADIILFLVSANFINTDYIWEHEIPIAEEQRKNGKARVIPIILKPCQWTKLDFAKQQALPSKGVPINSFPDRDAAWLEVVESIEKVIDDVLEK